MSLGYGEGRGTVSREKEGEIGISLEYSTFVEGVGRMVVVCVWRGEGGLGTGGRSSKEFFCTHTGCVKR